MQTIKTKCHCRDAPSIRITQP